MHERRRIFDLLRDYTAPLKLDAAGPKRGLLPRFSQKQTGDYPAPFIVLYLREATFYAACRALEAQWRMAQNQGRIGRLNRLATAASQAGKYVQLLLDELVTPSEQDLVRAASGNDLDAERLIRQRRVTALGTSRSRPLPNDGVLDAELSEAYLAGLEADADALERIKSLCDDIVLTRAQRTDARGAPSHEDRDSFAAELAKAWVFCTGRWPALQDRPPAASEADIREGGENAFQRLAVAAWEDVFGENVSFGQSVGKLTRPSKYILSQMVASDALNTDIGRLLLLPGE